MMEKFLLNDGPSIRVDFFVASERIESISLSFHEGCGLLCHIHEIDSGHRLKTQIQSWLSSYIAGRSLVDLPLHWPAFPYFTRQVLQTLQKVSYGTTVTYGQLATMAQNPKAYRAVGTACRKNPFPLLIPCHRVTSKNGEEKFSCDLKVKRILLEHEKHIFEK